MALLYKQLVEEWLNRQNFFTIRGIKSGNDEIDLLAIRPTPEGMECWHVEVQISYKLAMFQTRASLKQELSDSQDTSQIEAIERLIKQIDDRLETQKCLVTYSGSPDKSLYLDAVKRYQEFIRYTKEDVTKWGDKQM